MRLGLEILAVVTVAVAMALSLAHALELPGKLRLSREQYLATQPIYYPGFTIGGMAEPVGMLVILGLMLVTPTGGTGFWLLAAALAALIASHAAYWLLTHPVNNFWLRDTRLQGAGATFFSFGSRTGTAAAEGWMDLRDRWEFSHVVRAVLSMTSLILLTAAVAAR
jgi:hypothetical protein